MMRRWLALILFVAILFGGAPAWAQSGGNCAVFKSWTTNETLTAADLNSSFTTAATTNGTLACVDGISDTVANMQATATPWSSATESLATSATGEVQRLRYVLSDFLGLQYWYRLDRNVDFASTHSGAIIQGSGLGRHVTAVGLHTWSGSNLWPAITSVRAHQTGIMWGTPGAIFVGSPGSSGTGVANHMTVMVDATDDQGRFGIGQTNARTWYSFHAAALTLHHTAALRFAHSQSMMGNGQYGHVTAIRVSRVTGDAVLDSFGWQQGNDQLIFGHSTSLLAFEGGAYIFRTTAGQARTGGVQIDIPGAMATSGATGATLRIGAATTGAATNLSLWADSGDVLFDANLRAESLGVGVAASGTAGRLTVNESLIVSGTGPHAIGGATRAQTQLRLLGTFAPAGGASLVGLGLDHTITGTTGDAIVGAQISPTITEAVSGVHGLITFLDINGLITNGVATTTDAVGVNIRTFVAGAGTTNVSGLKIEAPTGATNNYSLWVASGTSRFDASVFFGGAAFPQGQIDLGTSNVLGFRSGVDSIRWGNNAAGTERMRLTDGGILALGTTVTTGAGAGQMVFTETTAPGVSGADKAILLSRDNGAGKTQLCAQFSSGAIQCFATEP